MKQPIPNLRAVLLDRDGVINEEPGPVLNPEQFRFIPGSAKAVALLNDVGWLCLLVTNQAALARGQLDPAGFAAVTRKMNLGFAEHGARINAQYICPHHPDWDSGKPLSKPKPCFCRKPEPGLLRRACREHGILPGQALMIGDTSKDFEAAHRLGCPSIGVRTGHAGRDGTCEREPDYWFADLAAAVNWLVGLEAAVY